MVLKKYEEVICFIFNFYSDAPIHKLGIEHG